MGKYDIVASSTAVGTFWFAFARARSHHFNSLVRDLPPWGFMHALPLETFATLALAEVATLGTLATLATETTLATAIAKANIAVAEAAAAAAPVLDTLTCLEDFLMRLLLCSICKKGAQASRQIVNTGLQEESEEMRDQAETRIFSLM